MSKRIVIFNVKKDPVEYFQTYSQIYFGKSLIYKQFICTEVSVFVNEYFGITNDSKFKF